MGLLVSKCGASMTITSNSNLNSTKAKATIPTKMEETAFPKSWQLVHYNTILCKNINHPCINEVDPRFRFSPSSTESTIVRQSGLMIFHFLPAWPSSRKQICLCLMTSIFLHDSFQLPSQAVTYQTEKIVRCMTCLQNLQAY